MQARLIPVVLCALAGVAEATPAQELEEARELFRASDFGNAIPKLNYLLYPTPRLSQTEDLVEAHVLLGVCSYESGNRKDARREFEEALFLDSDLELDTLLFSSGVVDYFDDVKQSIKEREERDAELRKIAEENERLRNAIYFEKHSFSTNFIPFGAGQFQNGQRSKALFFAISEGVTGGISAGLFLYIYGQYGFATTIKPEDARTVLRLQEAEIAAGSLCIGLMVWGVIDSLVHFEPVVRLPTPGVSSNAVSLTWEF